MDDTMNLKKKIKVYGSALLFSIVVGFSFFAIKISVEIAPPFLVVAHRFNFAALSSILLLLLVPNRFKWEGRISRSLLINAGLYAGFMLLQSIGLQYATSIVSGIIFAIVPILSKIIARILLGETGTWIQNAFVTLSVMAVVLMFLFSATGLEKIHPLGLFFLTISSICLAFSNVYLRFLRKRHRPHTLAFSMSIFGCVYLNLLMLVFGLKEGLAITDYFAPLFTWKFVLAMAFLGIPSTMISSLLMAYMMANLPAVKATIFGNLATAISILVGIIVLSEPFSLYHFVCTVLIIVGVVGTSMSGSRTGTKEGRLR